MHLNSDQQTGNAALQPDLPAWAKYYTQLQLRVHPVAPRDKKPPRWENWPDRATTDLPTVTDWWTAHPLDNIAVATGGSAFNVVDVETDIKTIDGQQISGEDSLNGYCQRVGFELTRTWTFRSGGGGIHRLYIAQQPLKSGTGILPAVDVRADGGYAIFPPSVHPNGNLYEWLPGSSPADMPQGPAMLPLGLLSILSDSRRDFKPPLEVPEIIPDGQRNDTMFRIACRFRKMSLTGDEIRTAMEGINQTRCAPPLDETELDTICEQAAKYEAGDGIDKIIQGAGAVLATYKPGDFSDVGNSAVFTRYSKACMLFVDAMGWYVWNGQKWHQSDHAAVAVGKMLTDYMLAEATAQLFNARSVLTAAQTGENKAKEEEAKRAEKAAKQYMSHSQKTRGRARIEAMLALSVPDFVIPLDSLDADPFILNSPAGMIDLRSRLIYPHDPAKLCSNITAVGPEQRGAELWAGFLQQITGGDVSLVDFLQQIAGMAAVGRVYMENLIIAYGDGGNGKSTYFNALSAVLGDYAGSINPDALTTDKQNKGADLARLKGKRLILAAELEEGKRLSTSVLKRIASTDKIQAERKYKDPEDFTPTHTSILFTNHLPRLGTLDAGPHGQNLQDRHRRHE